MFELLRGPGGIQVCFAVEATAGGLKYFYGGKTPISLVKTIDMSSLWRPYVFGYLKSMTRKLPTFFPLMLTENSSFTFCGSIPERYSSTASIAGNDSRISCPSIVK